MCCYYCFKNFTKCVIGGVYLDKEKIARNLKKIRGNKSRNQVAKDLGISISALNMYENAFRIPRDEIKVKIANYYGVSVQSIFFD